MHPDKTARQDRSHFLDSEVSSIIRMAWEDCTPFEAIELQFGLNESGVVRLMRTEMKASSFRMWRKRMCARATKHQAMRNANRHERSISQQAEEQRAVEG